MKINAWIAASDNGDCSFRVMIYNTKQEALESLDRTEEQLEGEDTCFYDDGIIREIEIVLTPDFKLAAPIDISNIE